jgi:hypothetical protein
MSRKRKSGPQLGGPAIHSGGGQANGDEGSQAKGSGSSHATLTLEVAKQRMAEAHLIP